MYTSHALMLVAQQALAAVFLLDCPPLCRSSVPQGKQSVNSVAVVSRQHGTAQQTPAVMAVNRFRVMYPTPYHVFKNVFAQDLLLPKLQQHVLVLGEHNCP